MSTTDIDNVARKMVMTLINIEPVCRSCGAEFSVKVRESFMAGKRVNCTICKWYGNWKYGTKLDGARITSIQFLFLYIKFISPNDIPAIAKLLRLDPGTVRQWRDRVITLTRGGN